MSFATTDNYFSLSIKRKVCDKWDEIDLYQALRCEADAESLIASLDGQEAVGRLKKGRKLVFMCGTPALSKKMAPKGTVVTFAQGLAYLKEHRLIPKMIAEINQPILTEALKVFEGVVAEVEIVPENIPTGPVETFL